MNLYNLKFRLQAKRYNNMTLNPLINVARKNLFYDWLKDHDKLGGQHKIQIIQPKRLFRAVEKLCSWNCIKLEKLNNFISWLHFLYKFLRTAQNALWR
jgi:hypothetical protein